MRMYEQYESFCKECPHYDELNWTCWLVDGRFGESVKPNDIMCNIGYEKAKANCFCDLCIMENNLKG